MKFSQRIGITPSTKQMQVDSIDDDLRNGLWNGLKTYLIDPLSQVDFGSYGRGEFKIFAKGLWHHFFKQPIDTIPDNNWNIETSIRKWFFNAHWFEIYDILEFVADIDTREISFDTHSFIRFCNATLQREFSGFRFIDNKIAPITNQYEIVEIESAISQAHSFTSLKGANIHLKSALTKLSDKKNPDYRNSIKESISAIESIAKIISNNYNDSLGAALDKIKGKINLHQALEKGFKQLYGYTSDASGIRHALMDNSTCEFEDAKYMLVSSSAFINYLIIKADKAGVKMNK